MATKSTDLTSLLLPVLAAVLFFVLRKDLKGLLGKDAPTESELAAANHIASIGDNILAVEITGGDFGKFDKWAADLQNAWNGWSWFGTNSHEIAMAIFSEMRLTYNYADYAYLYSSFGNFENMDLINWMIHEGESFYSEVIADFRLALVRHEQS